VVLLRAATLPWGIQRADDLGWGALVADLRVEEVQGYFGMTLVGPNVEGVAEQLSYHVRETLRHALADGTGAKSPAQADRDAPKRTGMRA
jgi:hypothetical protein